MELNGSQLLNNSALIMDSVATSDLDLSSVESVVQQTETGKERTAPKLTQGWMTTQAQKVTEQKVSEIRQVLEKHRGDRHLVALQDFPDPDALSCAWAYKLLAQQYDIRSDIVYAGALSHQENIALVRLTGLPAQRWTPQTAKDKDLANFQGCVLSIIKARPLNSCRCCIKQVCRLWR